MGFIGACHSEKLAGWNMNSVYKTEQSKFQNILARSVLSSFIMKTKKKMDHTLNFHVLGKNETEFHFCASLTLLPIIFKRSRHL